MPSSYTSNLRLVEQATGENSGTWGSILNAGMIALIDSAVAGLLQVATTGGTTTLSTANGASDQAREAIINVTGALTSDATIVAPTGVSKIYLVANNTSGSHNVIMHSAGGGSNINITQGSTNLCYTDGTNFFLVTNASAGLSGTAIGPIDMAQFLFDEPLLKRYQEFYNAMGNQSGAVNLNWNNGNVQSMTMIGNVTLTPQNFPATGIALSMTLKITQDGTGSRILTISGATVRVPGGGGLVLSTTPGAVDYVMIVSEDGGATLDCAILKNFS